MIASKFRFSRTNDLRRVYRTGQTVRGPAVSLRYRLSPNSEGYHAAVVVSKKIHKSAVKRNRVRRRIYEVIRLAAPAMKQPHEFIITVFSDQIIDWPADRLHRTLTNLMKKAGIL